MAQIQHWRKKLIYAKIETNPGEYVGDAALFLASNILVQAHDVAFDPKPAIFERKPDGPSLQSIASIPGQLPASLKFGHAFFTSGATGVDIAAPSFSAFLKACYMTETIVTSSPYTVTYVQDPTVQTSLSIGWEVLNEQGTVAFRYAMSGVRGNVNIKASKPGDPLMVEYNFEGALAVQEDGSPYPVQSTPVNPATIVFPNETANAIRWGQFQNPTGVFARQCNDFSFDAGVKVELLTDVTTKNFLSYAFATSHDPVLKVGYRVVPRDVDDALQQFINGTPQASSVQLGTVAGKKVTFNIGASAQYKGLSLKAIGSATGYDANIEPHRTVTGAASDAFSIVITG